MLVEFKINYMYPTNSHVIKPTHFVQLHSIVCASTDKTEDMSSLDKVQLNQVLRITNPL